MKRNLLRGWIPTTGLALALVFGTTVANAGVTVQGLTGSEDVKSQCTAKVDWGINVPGFGGVTVSGVIGIIVRGLTTKGAPCEPTVDKGITVSDAGGIIITD